jgi:hypothetical protein
VTAYINETTGRGLENQEAEHWYQIRELASQNKYIASIWALAKPTQQGLLQLPETGNHVIDKRVTGTICRLFRDKEGFPTDEELEKFCSDDPKVHERIRSVQKTVREKLSVLDYGNIPETPHTLRVQGSIIMELLSHFVLRDEEALSEIIGKLRTADDEMGPADVEMGIVGFQSRDAKTMNRRRSIQTLLLPYVAWVFLGFFFSRDAYILTCDENQAYLPTPWWATRVFEKVQNVFRSKTKDLAVDFMSKWSVPQWRIFDSTFAPFTACYYEFLQQYVIAPSRHSCIPEWVKDALFEVQVEWSEIIMQRYIEKLKLPGFDKPDFNYWDLAKDYRDLAEDSKKAVACNFRLSLANKADVFSWSLINGHSPETMEAQRRANLLEHSRVEQLLLEAFLKDRTLRTTYTGL